MQGVTEQRGWFYHPVISPGRPLYSVQSKGEGQSHCILIDRPMHGLRKLDSLCAAHMDIIPGMNLELIEDVSFI